MISLKQWSTDQNPKLPYHSHRQVSRRMQEILPVRSELWLRLTGFCQGGHRFYRCAATSTDNAVLRSVYQYAARIRCQLYAELVVLIDRFAEEPVAEQGADPETKIAYGDCLKLLQEKNTDEELLEALLIVETQLLQECDTLLQCNELLALHKVLQAYLPRLKETHFELQSLKSLSQH